MDRYDVIKSEMIGHKWMEDGPALHFVASLGAVRYLSNPSFYKRGMSRNRAELMYRELSPQVRLLPHSSFASTSRGILGFDED